ncbi:hypothetical protein F5Y08DRAFT_246664 [Xylaria arbuscula]|nr:hypothetical protein F5Y08DRAFT_246664 [Xylaria arbuscula]
MARAGLGSSWSAGRTDSDRVVRKNSNLGWANLLWIDAVGNGTVPHDGLIVSRSSQITNQCRFHGLLEQVARYLRHRTTEASTTEVQYEVRMREESRQSHENPESVRRIRNEARQVHGCSWGQSTKLDAALVTRQGKSKRHISQRESRYGPWAGGTRWTGVTAAPNHGGQQVQAIGVQWRLSRRSGGQRLTTGVRGVRVVESGSQSCRGPGRDRGCEQGIVLCVERRVGETGVIGRVRYREKPGARRQRFAATLRDPRRRSSHLIGTDAPCAACESSTVRQSRRVET